MLAAMLLVGGCALAPPLLQQHLPAQRAASAVELDSVPFFAQQAYQCGPAALAMLLASAGANVSPHALVPEVYLPGRQGSLQAELVAAVRRHQRLPYPVHGGLGPLLKQLDAGHPVLVLQNLALSSYPQWHYAVVIGYSASADTLILRSGTTRRLQVPARAFARTWQDAGQWALLALRPGELPANPRSDDYLAAAAALEATDNTEGARRAYAAAVARWPENATARLGLGNTLYGLGDSAAAERVFRELLAKQPRHVIARNNLAQLLMERGCPVEARSVIGPALNALDRADSDISPGVRDLVRQTASQLDQAGGDRAKATCTPASSR